MTQRRGLCEMAQTRRKQATTMESTGKQHETEPSIYGNDQTTATSSESLEPATTGAPLPRGDALVAYENVKPEKSCLGKGNESEIN